MHTLHSSYYKPQQNKAMSLRLATSSSDCIMWHCIYDLWQRSVEVQWGASHLSLSPDTVILHLTLTQLLTTGTLLYTISRAVPSTRVFEVGFVLNQQNVLVEYSAKQHGCSWYAVGAFWVAVGICHPSL